MSLRQTSSAPSNPTTGPTVRADVRLVGAGRRYRVGAGEVVALAGVDLHLDQGSFTVVLGPSGSGKTTLLNLVGALDTPTEGLVRLGETDLGAATPTTRARIRRELVSFVFQSFNLFPALTVAENVRFGADLHARDRVGTRLRVQEVIRRVGLADRVHHFPHQLSGGEQQRVAIARALATGNPILLADEPTGELDFATGVQILRLLQEQSSTGRTVVVVTHNREISRMADRVVELSGGRVVRDGPPSGGRAPVSALHW
jgi:putative ABC transport system ATP-binding protein